MQPQEPHQSALQERGEGARGGAAMVEHLAPGHDSVERVDVEADDEVGVEGVDVLRELLVRGSV